ncbi:TIGR03118 family protein [Nakamurella lactea]|uniref:TIGR03118 family protein n=1 Tax=Nakamurella lactea TaxID=459515 RepID=UPI00040D1479|nr:TIGR03118 family protein [Nakamurella lactea]
MSTSSAHLRRTSVVTGIAAAAALIVSATAPAAAATHPNHRHHHPADIEYSQVNLVSDVPGWAAVTDPNLVNPWGLTAGPTTPVWAADNGTGLSTLYLAGDPPTINPLVVSIPDGAPTGTVFNSTTGFTLSTGGKTGAARFLFATENGELAGWNPTGTATEAVTVAHSPGAVYKGLALIADPMAPRLLAADFHHARIDVFDANFQRVTGNHAFRSIGIPHGYAPFNVAVVGDRVLVSYAKQDRAGKDDVAGAGHGFVNAYDRSGRFVAHLIRRGALNSPWGMTIAPAGFGGLSGALLVGNFGDGRIHAYNPWTGRQLATLRNTAGRPLEIDGLWALMPGNGTSAATSDVWFSAGPDDEAHGLLGVLRSAG